MEISGRRFDNGQPVCLEIVSGRVAQVTACAADDARTRAWPWIAPGFVDLQVNGYAGHEFSSRELTVEKVRRIVSSFDAFGVVRCFPTVTTESLEVLEHALRTIAAACESFPEVARRVPGVHLEGPFITREDGPRGAHPLEHCREPDADLFRHLQEASGGRIRIHTMSPEYDGSAAFVRQLAESGVVVAIGHTAAEPAQIRAAVDAGARLSTHLGNGSHARVHRHHNYIWAQLAEDRLTASLIVDGHHLPPEVVKAFVRTKTPERCILISDMSGQAGQPAGRYRSDFCDVEILPSGRLVVAGQRELLAGAATPLGPAIPNVMHFAGVDLAQAVRMAVHNPADLVGLEPEGIDVGSRADLVQFRLADPPQEGGAAVFEPIATLIDGEVAWGTPFQVASNPGRQTTEPGGSNGGPTVRVDRPGRGSDAKSGHNAPLQRESASPGRPPQAG